MAGGHLGFSCPTGAREGWSPMVYENAAFEAYYRVSGEAWVSGLWMRGTSGLGFRAYGWEAVRAQGLWLGVS